MASTNHFGFNLPASGAAGWDQLLNQNFTDIDTQLAAASGHADAAAAQAQSALDQVAQLQVAQGSFLTSAPGSDRQTALDGPRNASGYADLFATSGLTATLAPSSAAPLIVSFAKGFASAGPVDSVRVLPASGSWTLAANATQYLFVKEAIDGSLSFETSPLSVSYGRTAPASVNLVPAMTSNVSAGATASASTELSVNYQAWKAFTGTPGGGYAEWVATGTSGWLALKYSAYQAVGSYQVVAPTSLDAADAPKAWTFEGSNDNGATWTVLDTRANQTAWAAGETRTYALTAGALYKMYRLNATANNGGAYLAIDELKLLSGFVPNQSRWFDTVAMRMKIWSANAWIDETSLCLGMAITDATSVTAIVSYALRGEYESSTFNVASYNLYSLNHNLGMQPLSVSVYVRKDSTYQWQENTLVFASSYYGGRVMSTPNTVSVGFGDYIGYGQSGSSQSQWGQQLSFPAASTTGECRVVVRRGW